MLSKFKMYASKSITYSTEFEYEAATIDDAVNEVWRELRYYSRDNGLNPELTWTVNYVDDDPGVEVIEVLRDAEKVLDPFESIT